MQGNHWEFSTDWREFSIEAGSSLFGNGLCIIFCQLPSTPGGSRFSLWSDHATTQGASYHQFHPENWCFRMVSKGCGRVIHRLNNIITTPWSAEDGLPPNHFQPSSFVTKHYHAWSTFIAWSSVTIMVGSFPIISTHYEPSLASIKHEQQVLYIHRYHPLLLLIGFWPKANHHQPSCKLIDPALSIIVWLITSFVHHHSRPSQQLQHLLPQSPRRPRSWCPPPFGAGHPCPQQTAVVAETCDA